MTRAIPIVSLVLAASAVALTMFPRDSTVAPATTQAAPALRDDDELDALKRKVDLIEEDQRAMWNRVLLLERKAVTEVAVDGGAVSPAMVAEVAQLKQELRAVMQGEVLTDPTGRAAMKEVVKEVEADLARERITQRQERQQQRAVEQQAKWKRFAADAKLTYQQEQTLNQRLSAEDAARKALFERGTPPEREELRTLRDQRRETDTIMLPLLDETQKQQYQELRQDDQGGGPNRRRQQQDDRPRTGN